MDTKGNTAHTKPHKTTCNFHQYRTVLALYFQFWRQIPVSPYASMIIQVRRSYKSTLPRWHPNSQKLYHCPTATGTVSLKQPSDCMILVIGPALGRPSVRERLRKLKEIHDEGLINDEEYKKKKDALLNQLWSRSAFAGYQTLAVNTLSKMFVCKKPCLLKISSLDTKYYRHISSVKKMPHRGSAST